jgi:hypothetical protein
MEMSLADRLARCLADVRAEVEPVWPMLLVELRAQLDGHAQYRVSLFWQKCEKIRFVTVGIDEDVSGIERLSAIESYAHAARGQ